MKINSLLVALILLCTPAAIHAEMSAEKRGEIEKMLQITGLESLTEQIIHDMIAGFRNDMPEVPEEFWTSFASKVNGREFIEQIIPIYDKYYSTDDLRAINAFYQSAAGQKILSTLPQVMQESMAVGEAWGKKLGEQALQEVMANQQKSLPEKLPLP